jgi:hypothetical protein
MTHIDPEIRDALKDLAEAYTPPVIEDQKPVNQGTLGAIVWPTYMGVATGDPGQGQTPEHEPWGEPDYERGQIHWHTEDGQIYGKAQVCAPKGVYTHFVFCRGCDRPSMMDNNQLDQPIVFDRAGFIDIDPIQFTDYLPRLPV